MYIQLRLVRLKKTPEVLVLVKETKLRREEV